jgi:GNAT superfamily N-acetyltransferase
MQCRLATPDDAGEVVRLAALLFDSMGTDGSGPAWQEAGRRQVEERSSTDMAAFVVDHPHLPRQLIASAAGTISRRLPTPLNPSGYAGYVQWVWTEPDFRGQGLAILVMASLLSWFESHDVPTVELHATPMAESLYRKLGFDDSGPRALRRRRR